MRSMIAIYSGNYCSGTFPCLEYRATGITALGIDKALQHYVESAFYGRHISGLPMSATSMGLRIAPSHSSSRFYALT